MSLYPEAVRGGHIYPAITIAEAIKEKEPTEILYVGSKTGLENTLIPKQGYDFVTLDVRGLERRLSVRNLVTAGKRRPACFKRNELFVVSSLMWSSVRAVLFAVPS